LVTQNESSGFGLSKERRIVDSAQKPVTCDGAQSTRKRARTAKQRRFRLDMREITLKEEETKRGGECERVWLHGFSQRTVNY
jgi:hypothetical protein